MPDSGQSLGDSVHRSGSREQFCAQGDVAAAFNAAQGADRSEARAFEKQNSLTNDILTTY
jgi:hypothetical protein